LPALPLAAQAAQAGQPDPSRLLAVAGWLADSRLTR